ncbi:MAG: serine/threonine protein kinase [Coleofasciculus sp. Co-bin14]|nr:serine/threonine protein kinase [Coleofasciculus sp. Co-bin14]
MIYTGLLLQDRYLVLHPLGKGGFGQTFEVDDLGRKKVLKVLTLDHCHNVDTKKKAVSLFQREAAVLSKLQHLGIPRVEHDGYFTLTEETGETRHCLVMEKIEGPNLKQWMTQRGNQPINQKQAIAWLKQLSDILAQVHQQELVHRDIKPSNIMLRPNGQLVLVDFGAVREITDTYLHKQKRNVTGTVIISAGYTPPEQVEGHAVTQSDFFALGRTFVYLLTGKHPADFDKNPRTGKLSWRDSAPLISKEFADLIDYLMAIFPGRRPQTAQMILRCIEEIVSPLPDLPPPVPLIPVHQKREATPTRKESPEPETRKPRPFLSIISSFLSITTPSHLWEKAKLRRTLFGHSDVVKSIAISPDGQFLASGSYDKTIKLWSLRTGELLNTLSGHTNRISCIAISPDSQFLASGSYDKSIKLWALSTGELLQTLVGHLRRVKYLSFSPNAQTLVSSGDEEIKVWAVRTGKLLRNLAGNSNTAPLVAFSPDGHTCAIGSLNGTLELWNPHTGKQLRTLTNQSCEITSLAFSPDGQTLASGCNTGIKLLSLPSGKQLQPCITQSNWTTSIAFSPDGNTLVSGSGKTIELWNWRAGKHLCILSGHLKPVESVAFSPDGKLLISGSSDQTIKIWQPIS